jgi:polyhydroxyalkanoate synthase
VFRNDTFELIQYSHRSSGLTRFLSIVPPWINKFYILDLNPKKSFVRWATEQGLTVFVVSWVNADEKQGRKSFSDYMREGFLEAVQAVQDATGAEKINTIGYCIGGTLVAAALGYMAAKNDNRVNAATFFTTQVDFEKAGDLRVYVDDEQVKWIEQRMEEKGYLAGSRMADAFNLLRSNDLIWSYVINNYMLGKEPMPFDLLYWNADSTRMPAGVHSFYLRECYLANKLSQGKMILDGVHIDLKKVKQPIYNLAAREDHIAPLPSVFKVGQFRAARPNLSYPVRAYCRWVNPPRRESTNWSNDAPPTPKTGSRRQGHEVPGPDWADWITTSQAQKSPRPSPDGKLEALEDAPGSYVRVKSE